MVYSTPSIQNFVLVSLAKLGVSLLLTILAKKNRKTPKFNHTFFALKMTYSPLYLCLNLPMSAQKRTFISLCSFGFTQRNYMEIEAENETLSQVLVYF